MDDLNTVFDLIIFVCCIYMCYGTFVMNRDKDITKSPLISKDLQPKKCKDLNGFIEKIVKPSYAVCGAFLIESAVGYAYSKEVLPSAAFYASLVFAFAVLVWYMVQYKKLTKEYWGK